MQSLIDYLNSITTNGNIFVDIHVCDDCVVPNPISTTMFSPPLHGLIYNNIFIEDALQILKSSMLHCLKFFEWKLNDSFVVIHVYSKQSVFHFKQFFEYNLTKDIIEESNFELFNTIYSLKLEKQKYVLNNPLKPSCSYQCILTSKKEQEVLKKMLPNMDQNLFYSLNSSKCEDFFQVNFGI